MTIIAVIDQKPKFRVDWTRVLHWMPAFAVAVFSFAAGGWVVSIRDQAESIPYKNRAAAHYEQVQKVTGTNALAQVNCLTKKGKVAEAVAGQAIVAAVLPDAPLPNLATIPTCPLPPKK